MRIVYLPPGTDIDMSSISLVIVGLLLFAATNGEDTPQKVAPNRNRRSLLKLYNMYQDVTGKDGMDFVNYGNYCGMGGSGNPVDPLDACCQSHDICYNEVGDTACKEKGTKALYGTNYDYVKNDKNDPNCGENVDPCSASLCLCDVVLVKCVKSNLQFFNPEYQHKLSLFEAIKEAQSIDSM